MLRRSALQPTGSAHILTKAQQIGDGQALSRRELVDFSDLSLYRVSDWSLSDRAAMPRRSHQKMPTYQFLLHTTGISLDLADGEEPAIGFYTSRRAKASSSEEAYEIVMAEMDSDPDLEDVFRSGHDAGRRPQTVSEQTYIIPWWRAILPWSKPGLMLYSDDSDEDDDSTAN